jgi:mRNA interferase RelE/StbE
MPVAYSVDIVPAALKELKALHSPVLERVLSALQSLSDSPRPRGCKKLVGSDCEYRLRLGDYRVIYKIDDSSRNVVVYQIRHRSRAYR